MTRTKISNEFIKLEVDPNFGASITQLCYRHENCWYHIMRPAPKELQSSSDANFVLAPYSNRIRDGKFSFDGKEYQLNSAEKHAIHGDIRNRSMSLKEKTELSVSYQLSSAKVDNFNFPFPLDFQVEYQLKGSTLISSIEIHNPGETIAPVGGGFHPYYLRCPNSEAENLLVECNPQIQFHAEGVYLYPDGVPIPSQEASALNDGYSFKEQTPLGTTLDNGFSGWDGIFEILWEETLPKSRQAIHAKIEASENCRELIVYSPTSEASFAVEPVSNVTDAFNLRNNGEGEYGTISLKPKESARLEYSLTLNSI